MAGAGSGLNLSSSGPPSKFNMRAVKLDGFACTTQTALARVVGACANGPDQPDCRSQLAATLGSGECLKLSAGTDVEIMAGSHSFDWVRLRTSGSSRPLWSERRLVLD